MTESLYDYDSAAALDSPESIAIFMTDAFETGDVAYIAMALGVVARAKGMAAQIGVSSYWGQFFPFSFRAIGVSSFTFPLRRSKRKELTLRADA